MIIYGTKSDILREMDFNVPCYHNAYDNMKITSSLRFLYIFGGSGLLCAAAHGAQHDSAHLGGLTTDSALW